MQADEIDSKRTKFFERVNELAKATGKTVIAVDDDGAWDRKRFAGGHILFPERTSEYEYLAAITGLSVGADTFKCRLGYILAPNVG
jgi:hypothetical protein